MCVRFVDSLWVVCEVPKVWWNTCHTLGTYRHTLGCSTELPKVLLEHHHTLGTYRHTVTLGSSAELPKVS